MNNNDKPTDNQKLLCSVIGAIIFFAAIWIGFYAMYKLPDWCKPPSFVSMLAIAVFGVALIVAPWMPPKEDDEP